MVGIRKAQSHRIVMKQHMLIGDLFPWNLVEVAVGENRIVRFERTRVCSGKIAKFDILPCERLDGNTASVPNCSL